MSDCVLCSGGHLHVVISECGVGLTCTAVLTIFIVWRQISRRSYVVVPTTSLLPPSSFSSLHRRVQYNVSCHCAPGNQLSQLLPPIVILFVFGKCLKYRVVSLEINQVPRSSQSVPIGLWLHTNHLRHSQYLSHGSWSHSSSAILRIIQLRCM